MNLFFAEVFQHEKRSEKAEMCHALSIPDAWRAPRPVSSGRMDLRVTDKLSSYTSTTFQSVETAM